jgi:enoyl-CoA hydratase
MALKDALLDAERDVSCRSVILSGAGERAFTAGADLREMARSTSGEVGRFLALGQEVAFALERCSRPVIAALNGFALGGGCEMALACDFILASETAEIGLPEVHVGILPGWGGTQRLPRRIGLGRAREMILTGRRVPSAEALAIGLFDEVHLPDGLLPAARALAARLSELSPAALAAAKRAVNSAGDLSLQDGCALEAELFVQLFDTEERRAAMQRFVK